MVCHGQVEHVPHFHDGLFRLFEPGKIKGYIMAIQIFLDESGHISDSKLVVVGAVAAIPGAWEALADEWCKKLRSEGIIYLSMKEAMNFRGQFSDWKDRVKDRDELLRVVAGFANRFVSIATAMYVSAEAFHAASSSQKRGLWNNPLYPGVEGCIKHVMARTDPGEPIQICCDSSEEYAIDCLKIYHRMRRFNADFKRRCGNIAFGEDEFFVGLQLADMYAYCVREQASVQDASVPLIDELMLILSPRGHHEDEYSYEIGKGIGQGIIKLRQRINR
jgi:hypothetical protein